MTERIQRVLDGELARQTLTVDETAELEAYEVVIRDAIDALAPPLVPDIASAVTDQIAATAPSEGTVRRTVEAARRLLGWIWTPRTLAVRPAYGVAAVVMALGVAALIGRAPTPRAETAGADAPKVLVHFRIDAPGAAEVRLAGDFSGWQPTYALHESAPGVWSVIVPLAAGVHHYAFAIDGERWVPDPHAPQVDDGFGGVNSRLAVLLPETRSVR